MSTLNILLLLLLLLFNVDKQNPIITEYGDGIFPFTQFF